METFGYHTVADSLRETARSLGRAAGHAAIPACEGGGQAESKPILTIPDNSKLADKPSPGVGGQWGGVASVCLRFRSRQPMSAACMQLACG